MDWKTETTLREDASVKPVTLAEHQARAGRSKSEKKLASSTRNLEKAWQKRRQENPSKGALYQRARRAKLKPNSET